MAKREFNNTLVASRWRAYDPNGNYKETVTLTYQAKLRYERLGWKFTRPGIQVWGGE